MQKDELIHTLNLFYNLELQQVDLYTAQSHVVDDLYLSKTLARIAYHEQQHVDIIAEEIKKLGGQPNVIVDYIAPLVGKAAGAFSSVLGIEKMLKINIFLEEKAMKDYKDLILKSGNNSRLFEILWNNLIDEDLHAAWLASKLRELEGKNRS
ncbi:demethoxyubiquinone hydroxylase family protein [Desulfolucanica intricata]|uniref:demethoxyubiquinone hydroxylase family protein n=1 Tax=Desulfolucanica intricata TaxID=1285191 RepID=UPI0009ED3A4F|nr:ferritin-like domain-containing protein [Desulfolucanica intricata]